MAKSDAEVAIELRSKFEFYLLGLTFTILGLSIQTAKFGNSNVADFFELLGWLGLLVSGIVGLLRGEWIPVAHSIQAQLSARKQEIHTLIEAGEAGGEVPLTFIDGAREVTLTGQQAIDKLDGLVRELERQRFAAEKKIITRYGWMKYSFLAGIVALVVARSYPHVISVGSALAAAIR